MPFLGGQRNPESDGKAMFQVAPKFLPKWFAGDYWIIGYENEDTDDAFAIFCGGQPTIATCSGRYTYDTDATNHSGLWIFTRKQNPEHDIVKQAEQIIVNNGISLQGLNPVKQQICCDYKK